MAPRWWGKKNTSDFDEVKDSELEQGASSDEASDVATRTVTKEDARKGTVSEQVDGPTKAELLAEAKNKGIKGRSSMSKAELMSALEDH